MCENDVKKQILFPNDLKNFRIHFVGIKGTGMAALVEICVSRGAIVTGSDVPDSFYTDEILKKLNIIPYTEFNSHNITNDIQLVVYSSAYKIDANPELVAAQKLNIPCVLYSQALGNISAMSNSSGIAGVHGKTTTTGIAGTLIKSLNLPAQVLAGSVIKSFVNSSEANNVGSCTLSLGHKYFVAETCEYQRHFMDFHPQNIILTSVESDHQDFYPTFEDIQQAFIDYALLLPENFGNLIYCADDKGACDTAEKIKKIRSDINFIPYGFSAQGFFKILSHTIESGLQKFTISLFKDKVFSIKVPGVHNVRNSVASIALMTILYANNLNCNFTEISNEYKQYFIEKISEGLLEFSGSKRRSEILAELQLKNSANKVIFIDDYGHHPTAIKTTLQGFKNFYPDKYLIVDFMSHTYSRTASLLEEFASSFNFADQVILHKIYSSARENKKDFEGIVSGQILFNKTKNYHSNVSYFEEILDAKDFVKEIFNSSLPKDKNGFVFVTMGAGDNWKLGSELIGDLQNE